MIEKKTILDQIEITRDGTIQVRLALVLFEDGEEVSSTWHRTSIPPGIDPRAQMAAVNGHLVRMKKQPVKDTLLLEQVCTLVHTKEVSAAYAEKQKVAETLLEGKLK